MSAETLLSVGIDLGTTTTQLVFSRLTVRNEGSAFSVPNYTVAAREVLRRSAVHFTPLRSERELDAEAIARIDVAEYAAAGIDRRAVQTGAVIITGETARRENARAVLEALSGYAGDFVVATAGPALESALAGRGAGAADYAQAHACTVVNLDIGGGTTNHRPLHERGADGHGLPECRRAARQAGAGRPRDLRLARAAAVRALRPRRPG